MKKVGGWVAGILSAVIAGVLISYFSRPTPAPPPPIQPSVTTFEGMVIDGVANVVVPNAMVTVEIENAPNTGPYHDPTNENGSYRIDLTGLSGSATAVVQVAAKGFQAEKPVSFSSLPPDLRKDFTLMPIPASGPVVVPHFPAAAQRPLYVQKSMLQGRQFKVPGNP